MNILVPGAFAGQSAGSTAGETVPPSVIKIVEGALNALVRTGAKRMSMSDISDAAGVSRGTVYKYFATKQDVLAAVSEFVSLNFENGVRNAAAEEDGPIERLRAVMRFLARFTYEKTPDRLFELEPAFHLDFFRSHFHRHVGAVREALTETFDWLEQRSGEAIDRHSVAQALVRMQLSGLIVPPDPAWVEVWENAPDHVERLLLSLAGAMPAPTPLYVSQEI
jgi:AcrR family transcriptional regulator